MAPLPTFPSSLVSYIVIAPLPIPTYYIMFKKSKILDLLLTIAFNANLYYLTIDFFLLFPNVDNCKNWQYLYYYVK